MAQESLTVPYRMVFKFDWLLGKRVDVLFFYFPILIGVFCYLVFNDPNNSIFLGVLIANAFGAGPLHFGATWFAYFDKKNLGHYWGDKRKRAVFFLMPAIIVALTMIGVVVSRPLIVFIWQVWSIQHLVQQNVGILLLYHRPNGGEAVASRAIEAKSLQLAAIFFYLVFFHRVMLGPLSFVLVDVVTILSLLATIVAVYLYIAQLIRQLQQGRYLNVPAFLFWIFSLFCLAPLAYLGQHYADGFMIPLTVHWFQYIAINYLLVKRKYTTAAVSNLPGSHPVVLFASVCLVMLLVMFALDVLRRMWLPQTIMHTAAEGLLMSIALTHYYLDAFLWRFRDPFQRENVLPYVKSAVMV